LKQRERKLVAKKSDKRKSAPKKDPAAVALGSKGGAARAKKLSKKERSDIASKGGKAAAKNRKDNQEK
jgi:hypothetical protein